MHTLMTGDPFYAAPEASVRTEIELLVDIDESVFEGLEGIGDEGALRAEIAKVVLDLADVGLRFYPVLANEYGQKDIRPERMMVVQVQGLSINVENKLIEEKDQAPRIESSVKSLTCSVDASVKKRRAQGPSLSIGDSEGVGNLRVKDSSETAAVTYQVKHDSADEQPLEISRQDVLDAVEKAVVDALRELVKPIDRDLAPSESAQ